MNFDGIPLLTFPEPPRRYVFEDGYMAVAFELEWLALPPPPGATPIGIVLNLWGFDDVRIEPRALQIDNSDYYNPIVVFFPDTFQQQIVNPGEQVTFAIASHTERVIIYNPFVAISIPGFTRVTITNRQLSSLSSHSIPLFKSSPPSGFVPLNIPPPYRAKALAERSTGFVLATGALTTLALIALPVAPLNFTYIKNFNMIASTPVASGDVVVDLETVPGVIFARYSFNLAATTTALLAALNDLDWRTSAAVQLRVSGAGPGRVSGTIAWTQHQE